MDSIMSFLGKQIIQTVTKNIFRQIKLSPQRTCPIYAYASILCFNIVIVQCILLTIRHVVMMLWWLSVMAIVLVSCCQNNWNLFCCYNKPNLLQTCPTLRCKYRLVCILLNDFYSLKQLNVKDVHSSTKRSAKDFKTCCIVSQRIKI